jgi:hypothetical protein
MKKMLSKRTLLFVITGGVLGYGISLFSRSIGST